jgi:hypothetical protein
VEVGGVRVSYGVTLGPVRSIIVARLQARAGLQSVAVAYDQPSDASDVLGATGTRQAIWLKPEVQGANATAASLSLSRNEDWQQIIVVQALPIDSSVGQQAADEAVSLLAGEIKDEFTANHRIDTIPGWTVNVLPLGTWTYYGAVLGPNTSSGAVIELDIQINATTC